MHRDPVHGFWETELDRLELDVIRVERLLKGLAALPSEPWDPGDVPGQMPLHLALRAQELLDRQRHATVALEAALATAQHRLAFADRVQRTRPPASASTPVYVDLQA